MLKLLTQCAGTADCFKRASIELRADREVVLAAVAKRGGAIEYASEELRADRGVVLTAVEQCGPSVLRLKYASEELRRDLDGGAKKAKHSIVIET